MLNDKGKDTREGRMRSVVMKLCWLVLDNGEKRAVGRR